MHFSALRGGTTTFSSQFPIEALRQDCRCLGYGVHKPGRPSSLSSLTRPIPSQPSPLSNTTSDNIPPRTQPPQATSCVSLQNQHQVVGTLGPCSLQTPYPCSSPVSGFTSNTHFSHLNLNKTVTHVQARRHRHCVLGSISSFLSLASWAGYLQCSKAAKQTSNPRLQSTCHFSIHAEI